MDLGAFVVDERIVLEGDEAMSESDRNPEREVVPRTQFATDPFGIGRRTFSEIDRDIEDGTLNAPDQLAHSMRLELVVHSAERSPTRLGQIVLDEDFAETRPLPHRP